MPAVIPPSPEAQALAGNLDAMHAAGHTNLDPLAQIAVAQGAGSTQSVLDHSGLLNQAVKQTTPDKSISEPAVNQQPSLLSSAASFLHHQYGPIPILNSDIAGIQQQLQSKGYGKDLATGVWNSQWQSVLSQHSYDATVAPKFGNVKSLPLWERIVNDIAPSGWSSTIAHSVASYVRNMPAQARSMIGNLSGQAASTWDAIAHPSEGSAAYTKTQFQTAADIQNTLGAKTTAAELQKNQIQNLVQDYGNLLSLVGLAGAGKALATSVGAVGKSLLENTAAKESVSAAAKALVTRSLPESAASTPTFFVSKSLYQGGVEGAKGTGLLRWMENVPVAKRMLPAIDAMDTEGSTYYNLKMQQASLMRNPIWQVAAQAQAKGSLAGLGLTAIGEAEQKAGINEQDANLAAPYQGSLANAVNFASMFMGHPTIGLKASQNVGQIVDAAHGALSDTLGPINMDYVLKKGLGISLTDLQKNLGNEFVNDHFLNTKVNQYAASHYADDALQTAIRAGTVDKNTPEAAKLFSQYEHEALSDPAGVLAPARDSLIRQPDVLANYFKKDFANQLGSNVRKGVTDTYDIAD